MLRNEWGFDGVVMTDWFATNAGQADDALCIAAGNDLIMPGTGSARRKLLAALKRGALSRSALRRSARNVVKAVLRCPIQREYIRR